jgi:hypothetical protein
MATGGADVAAGRVLVAPGGAFADPDAARVVDTRTGTVAPAREVRP